MNERAQNASTPLTPLASALADRYRIERELGAGGMATVYLAHDVKHDRKVAVKVLRPELSAILGAQRFLTEIKTTANLQHPHILSLFDSGEADGTVFYVMPYVEGETLRDRIKRDQQLPVDEALRIAREVLDALGYAHKQGIVHRDVKPENIMLHGGHAMVVDFGIALAASKVEGGTRMTETGMSLGTPHYMSPEQAMGEREITPRADIYAVGCVLYEMLTAEPPFVGATAQAIFARVLTDEPRSLTLQRKTIPPHVEGAVRTALQKLPADRFASAAEFSAALADTKYTTATGAARVAAPARSRPSAFMLGIAASVATAALVGGFLLGRGNASRPFGKPVHFVITLPDSVTSINRCCGRGTAISPDGSTLAYVGLRGARGVLYRRPLGQLESTEIPGTVDATIPFFSPDGAWLGFESDGKLRKLAMSGGPSTPITVASAVAGASWADGDVIVYSQNNRLWTVPAAGGTPRLVPTTDTLSRYLYPFALPGGKTALATVVSAGGGAEVAHVGVIQLESGRVDTAVYGMRAEYASGYLLFGAPDNTLIAQPFDAARGRTTGQATVLMSGVRLPGGMQHEFAVSTNGWLTYGPGGSQSGEALRTWSAGGRQTIALPGRQGVGLEDPAISPDGRWIAIRLGAQGSTGGNANQDIWLLDRRQGTLTRFTVGGGQAPVWSRDGRSIAYTVPPSDTAVQAGMYVRAADQTGVPKRVLGGAGLYPAAWLPGDRALLFTASSRTRTRWDVGIVALGDSTPRWLLNSEFNENNAALSPDGRRVAFVSDRTGRTELYVQSLAPGSAATQISTDGGTAPRWGPDGRSLYFVENNTSIVVAGLSVGDGISVVSRKVIMDGTVLDLNASNVNWDLFPDGKQILYIDQAQGTPRTAVIQNWVQMVRAMSGAK